MSHVNKALQDVEIKFLFVMFNRFEGLHVVIDFYTLFSFLLYFQLSKFFSSLKCRNFCAAFVKRWIEVTPDVEGKVPCQLQKLEDHDDCDSGEEAKRTSQC
jgi:hypothetical protein